MSHSPKSLERSKKQVEIFRQAKRLADERTIMDYNRWCKLIAECRAKAKMSRRELAERAGISLYTVRYIERASGNSISADTLNRLRNVPELCLPLSLDDDEQKLANGYRAWILADYDQSRLSDEARDSLIKVNARIPYDAIHASKESVDLYHSVTETGAYGKWVNSSNRSISQIVTLIPKYIVQPKLDVISLTIGHGWGEAKLVDEILRIDDRLFCRVSLVTGNSHIMSHGLHEFSRRISNDCKHRFSIVPVLGQHTSYLHGIDIESSNVRQKLFCLFGTIMNMDGASDFIKKICQKMSKNDLLLLDVMRPYAQSDVRSKIFEEDPRFSGRLPKQYISAVEHMFEFSLSASDPSINQFEWFYTLDDLYGISSNSMETYTIHMNAVIHRNLNAPQQVSCMRIHRHDSQKLSQLLAGCGLKLVEECSTSEENSITYPACRNLLFVRK